MARPLTKMRKNDGVVYTRSARIEALIDSVVGLETHVLCQRADSIRDKEANSYIPSECLVYLIREARRGANEDRFQRLISALFTRCERNLKSRVANSLPRAEDLRQDIMSALAELFLREWEDENENKLDFYEIRFQRAFACLRINIVNAEMGRMRTLVPLPAPDPESEKDWGDDSQFAGVPLSFGPEGLDHECWQLVDALPVAQKQAFVICRLWGLKEKSINPNEPTASSLLGVDERTVRNRLSRALSALRKEVKE